MSLVTDDKAAAPAGDVKDATAGGDAAAKAAADKAAADAAAGAAVTVDEQRKFLVDAGGKADELAKLSEADLKVKYTEAKTAADAKNAVPADGKYTFKTPEGVTLDNELVTEVSAWAKEHKIPQASAQKLVDMGAKIAQRANDAVMKQVQKVHGEWTEQSRSDKEFGGPEFDKNLAIAKSGLKALDADGALTKVLDETGLGNHPAVIRALFRHGKTLKEDSTVTGKPAGQTERTPYLSYPNSKHNA